MGMSGVACSASVGPAIEVRQVSKWFPQRAPLVTPWRRKAGIRALTHVDFQVPPGTVFALIGPNGAGKTTLLRILATLLVPDEGQVWINGYHHMRHPERIRRTLSFAIGQERSFYWRLTCRQNLEFFATLYELSPRETRSKIEELGHIFGLEASLDRPYEQLSTGTRQRLGLARSFLNDAAILLADEPTRSLDPLSKQELKGVIRQLSRKWGKTILFTTHDLHEAEELADTIGILHQGHLRAVGTPGELRSLNRQGSLQSLFAHLCEEGASGANAA